MTQQIYRVKKCMCNHFHKEDWEGPVYFSIDSFLCSGSMLQWEKKMIFAIYFKRDYLASGHKDLWNLLQCILQRNNYFFTIKFKLFNILILVIKCINIIASQLHLKISVLTNFWIFIMAQFWVVSFTNIKYFVYPLLSREMISFWISMLKKFRPCTI